MSLGLARRGVQSVRRVLAAAGSVVSDTFNRADGVVGIADTGQTWVTLAGAWSIVANRLGLTSAGELVVDAGIADATVQATITTLTASADVLFRGVDVNNYWIVDTNGSNFSLFKRVGGTFTAVGSAAVGAASGDVIAVVVSGSSIIVKRNGTQIIAVTDAFNSTATRYGFRCTATNAQYDDFSVTA